MITKATSSWEVKKVTSSRPVSHKNPATMLAGVIYAEIYENSQKKQKESLESFPQRGYPAKMMEPLRRSALQNCRQITNITVRTKRSHSIRHFRWYPIMIHPATWNIAGKRQPGAIQMTATRTQILIQQPLYVHFRCSISVPTHYTQPIKCRQTLISRHAARSDNPGSRTGHSREWPSKLIRLIPVQLSTTSFTRTAWQHTYSQNSTMWTLWLRERRCEKIRCTFS